MPPLQDKVVQSTAGFDTCSMPSPRPDEGFFHSVQQDFAPVRLEYSARHQELHHRQHDPEPLKNKAFEIPSRTSSIASLQGRPDAVSRKRPNVRVWAATRPRSDRQPERPSGMNDENQHPFGLNASITSPARRDSEVTVRQDDLSSKRSSAAGDLASLSLSASPFASPAASPARTTKQGGARSSKHESIAPSSSSSSQGPVDVLMLQSPVQQRPSSKRTFNQSQLPPTRPDTPPTWVTSDPFAQFRPTAGPAATAASAAPSHGHQAAGPAAFQQDMDIADVVSSGPSYGGLSAADYWADDASTATATTSSTGGAGAKLGMGLFQPAQTLRAGGLVGGTTTAALSEFGLFSDPAQVIQPVPTLSPAAFSRLMASKEQRGSGASSPLALLEVNAGQQPQQRQQQQQQLGQPFLPFGEPDHVSRSAKPSKKTRRSTDFAGSKPSEQGQGSATTQDGSEEEKAPSSRMRMPSHTSLLLGLSLGPAFGDEDSSCSSSSSSGAGASAALPMGGIGSVPVGGLLADALPSPVREGKKGGKRRSSRCASIEREKVTKATRLPLGGSPSFGLNIMGLGDALELDSAYIYLEKDAACQSPVPSIVITPPPVVVAHTPSRLARSESKPGVTLALAMSGLESVEEDQGSKLAPAPIATDSPSVRSISSTLTMTALQKDGALSVAGGVAETPASSVYGPIVSPPDSISPPPTARAGCAPGEWGRKQQRSAFASPPEIDPVVMPVIQQRMAEDQTAFTELALEIDVILSEYIYINSPTQAWIVGRRLTTLLLNAFHGSGLSKAPPTLRKARQVGDEVLPEAWLQTESERLLEKVLDHVVTGILVVLADPRSPFETPQSLAQLCCSLKMSLSASAQGARHTAEVDIPCLSPYGGMIAGQTSPPDDPLASRDIGALFEEVVLANLRDILQKGEEVRDRAHRLDVPLARKGNKKKWELASSERLRAAADQQKNRKLAAKGLISGDEFVKLERKRAAKGHVRDQFADISVLRFVGELFRVSFIGLTDIQAWLERMLFDTVYPGVPSIYELGCACALITIVGPQLESIADKEDRRAYEAAAKAPTSRILAVPETPIRSAGGPMSRSNWMRPLRTDAPANHWIQCSPAAAIRSPPSPFSTSTRTVSCGSGTLSLSSFGSLHSVQSSCSSNWSGSAPALSPPPTAKMGAGEARLTVTSCMERLEALLKLDDMDDCVKEIITSVLGLHARGWVASSIPFTPTRFAV